MMRAISRTLSFLVIAAVLGVSILGFSHMANMGMNGVADCQSSAIDHATCPTSVISAAAANQAFGRMSGFVPVRMAFVLTNATLVLFAFTIFIFSERHRSSGILRYLAFLQHSPSA